MEIVAWVQQHDEAMERQASGKVAPAADKVLVRLRGEDGGLMGQLVLDWREAATFPVKARVQVSVELAPEKAGEPQPARPVRVVRAKPEAPEATAKG